MKNFGVNVTLTCKLFWNPKFFGSGFQMFSKNVYINVSVHAASDKMKISHSWRCHASSHHHAATMLDHWTKTFGPRSFPGHSPHIITSIWSKNITFPVLLIKPTWYIIFLVCIFLFSPEAWIFVCCQCRVLSGRGLCDELITRPEESYRMCCVVVCDLETSRMVAPYIYMTLVA